MSIVADPHLSASHPILFCGHVYLKLLCNPDNVIRKISRNWPSFLAIAWLTVTCPHYRSPILSPSISVCLCPIPIHSPLDEYNCFTCGSGWLAGWQPTRRDLCPLSANQSICLKFNGISHSMPPTTSFASLLAMTEAFGVDPPACLPAASFSSSSSVCGRPQSGIIFGQLMSRAHKAKRESHA